MKIEMCILLFCWQFCSYQKVKANNHLVKQGRVCAGNVYNYVQALEQMSKSHWEEGTSISLEHMQ